MSAESGLPSIDPEVKDTVDGDGEGGECGYNFQNEKPVLISVKLCMREVMPYLTG